MSMFGKLFELNEQTLSIIETIGGHMPGGFFIYKSEAPEELLYANKAVLDIYGCETLEEFKELTGYTFQGMVHPEDYDRISVSIVEQIETSEDQMDYAEYRIIRKDGAVRWVDDYGHYAETKAYGGIYTVFISDITEKRERRENDFAVRDAVIMTLTNSYNTVWLINDVEKENCSLYYSDMDSLHREAIENALSHAKYTDTKTQYVATMVAKEDQERMQEQISLPYIRKQFEDKNQYSVTFLRAFETGPRYYRIDFGKVYMPGDKIGITMGFKDVDDEVRLDQEMQQNLKDAMEAANASSKAKTSFLASMSHDMRTPMNGIIGMTAIAAANIDDRERVLDCLEKITASSNHLLSLINEVLDMNKIESGKVDLSEEAFDLSELTDMVLAILRPQVEAREHTLSVHLGEIQHEKVVGDSTRVRQILVNVLSNAIKYTPNGGQISLTVEEKNSNLPEIGHYEFTVEDNGIGMKPDFLEHLFEPFSRAEDKATQSQQGTGLGMAITRNLVRMMGGDIQVESTYGVGTRFTISIYLRLQEPESAAEQIEHKPYRKLEELKFEDKQILLVEDNLINAEIAINILQTTGLHVDHVTNGEEALIHFQSSAQGTYSLIFMDIQMPVMNGYEASRKIRELDRSDAKTIPILAMTANAFEEDKKNAYKAGMNGHLAKPLNFDELSSALQKWI